MRLEEEEYEQQLLRSAAASDAKAASPERERIDQELAREQERFRITLASIGDAVISTDAEGRVVFLNAVAERFTEWSDAKATGHSVAEVFRIFDEHTRRPVENPALCALRQNGVVDHANHAILLGRNGSERPVNHSTALIRDRAETIVGAVLIFSDATERKLAEEARIRLAAIVESSDDAIVTKSLDGVIRTWNAGAERIFGYTAEEAVGQPITLIIPRERIDEEHAILEKVRRGERVDHFETVRTGKDGRRLDISVTVSPIKDREGRIVGASKVGRDFTERKRAELALRESEDRRRHLADNLPSGFIYQLIHGTDDSRRFTYLSAGVESLCGVTPAEIVEDPLRLYGLIHEEDVAHVRTMEDEACRARKQFDCQFRLGRGQHTRWLHCRSAPRELPNGDTVWDGIAIDVTERTQTEQSLRASEGRHRFLAGLAAATERLTDSSELIATTIRLLAEYLDVDRCAFAEIEDESVFVINSDHSRGIPSSAGRWPVAAFGAECIRLMLMDKPFIVSDVDIDSATGTDLTAYRKTDTRSMICVPLHRADRFVAAMVVQQKTPRQWSEAEVELVKTVLGRSWEFIERTRVTQNVKEIADRLGLALTAARLGDWSWDAGTDMVTLSERAAEIFGIPAGPHMTWTRMQDLLHDADRDRVALEVKRATTTGTQYDVEYRLQLPAAGASWVSARGRAQYDADGQALGMFGVVQDISEQKRLEGELRRRAQELADADRKKDDFIALLAHELRNPLAPLRTGLQVMRLASGDAGKVAQTRAMMDRQLSHMVRLIDDLLDISRLNRNKLHLLKSRVLLTEVVNHAVETALPALEAAGHELIVRLPPEPIDLDADLTRLAQVFGNLLTNSAKYTEPGGKIWLACELAGGEAIVSVRDTGIGIHAVSLPRIFDMFSQGDRAAERNSGGLGIGLALVKGLVEMHGGTVSAASPGPGHGSTFTVRVPVASGTAESSRAEIGEEASLPLRMGRRILVVDDNRDGADSMTEMLSQLGNEVYTARDGAEAVEAAERIVPDLILMDVGMPRLNGLDATRRIREHPWGRGITIIALTGWGQPGDRERSRSAGCDGHMVKPISFTDLETLLAETGVRAVER